MKINTKTLPIVLISICCMFGSMAFGQTVQEKTMFYGETITGIKVSNSFDVAVIKGDDNYLKLEYDPIFADRIEAKINNGILELGLSKGPRISVEGKMVLKAIVCVSDLTVVNASGSVDIHFVGNYSPKETSIIISGSSDIYGLHCKTEKLTMTAMGSSDIEDCNIEAAQSTISISGSSDVTNFKLNGTQSIISLTGSSDFENASFNMAQAISIEASGSSDLKNIELQATDVELSLAGSCDFLKSTVQCSKINLSASGSSTCNVSGKATEGIVSLMSSATAEMKNFEMDHLEASLSSSSSGYFKVNGTLSFSATSASDLYIFGNPKVEKSVTTSGASVHYNN